MTSPDSVLTGSYDHILVALSVLIAILASYAALDLARHVTSAQGRARLLWLTGGANAMGFGIWSMHYIGMLAFRLPIPVQYDWPTVLLSLLAAILASAIALFVVSRSRMGVIRAVLGSIFMGGGIATMHYTGMAAMRVPAMCNYSAALVTLSVFLAIMISLVALFLTFYFRGDTTAWSWRKMLSAMVMEQRSRSCITPPWPPPVLRPPIQIITTYLTPSASPLSASPAFVSSPSWFSELIS